MKKNPIHLLIALFLCAALLASCAKRGDTPTEPSANDTQGQIVNLSAAVDAQRKSGSEITPAFKGAVNSFTLELFKETVQHPDYKGQNVLMSPLSCMYALAMVTNGADGNTLSELETVLGGELSIAQLNDCFTRLEAELTKERSPLSMANSIWFRDDELFTVKDTFLQDNAFFYGADIYKAPFNDTTKDAINAWASDHTDGMIKKVLEEIPSDTMMYLLNAILFDGVWAGGTIENSIEDQFTAANGTVQTVTMMQDTVSGYLEDEHATGFIKRYENGYSFLALLPEEGMSVEEYASNLTGNRLQKLLSDLKHYEVRIGLPEFSTSGDYLLNDQLINLGIRQAFTSTADLSRLGSHPAGPLTIDLVRQNTKIEVTKTGTKAAAVTSIAVTVESAIESEYREVILNRPFLYAIIHDDTGIPMFIGMQNTIER